MTVIYTCPNCTLNFEDPQSFIAHRFAEIGRWFAKNGEHDNARAYITKDPADYQVVNGLIEKKVP